MATNKIIIQQLRGINFLNSQLKELHSENQNEKKRYMHVYLGHVAHFFFAG